MKLSSHSYLPASYTPLHVFGVWVAKSFETCLVTRPSRKRTVFGSLPQRRVTACNPRSVTEDKPSSSPRSPHAPKKVHLSVGAKDKPAVLVAIGTTNPNECRRPGFAFVVGGRTMTKSEPREPLTEDEFWKEEGRTRSKHGPIWVWFADLPKETYAKLRHRELPSFSVSGRDGKLIWCLGV
jgi:hypothetical protein